jgi:hypothetical protein
MLLNSKNPIKYDLMKLLIKGNTCQGCEIIEPNLRYNLMCRCYSNWAEA